MFVCLKGKSPDLYETGYYYVIYHYDEFLSALIRFFINEGDKEKFYFSSEIKTIFFKNSIIYN